MQRKEQIQDAAADHKDCVCCGFYDPVADARQNSFIKGAEWADEHPDNKHVYTKKQLLDMGFGLKFHEFLKSGGWIEIIAVGAFGISGASAGMIRILVDSYNESGADLAFWFMVVIGAIVWGTLAFAVWAIARIIRRHRDIFKI